MGIFKKLKNKFYVEINSPQYYFLKNSARLKRVCKLILDIYNETHFFSSDNADLIMKYLENEFETEKAMIVNWGQGDSVDFIKEGYAFIASTTFDMLASGLFHRYGALTYIGEYILQVYKNCMEYALKTKQIDEKTYDDEIDKLYYSMRKIR